MALSAAGLGSGLDVNGLVSQLMAIERKPLDLLKRGESSLQSTLSAYGRVSSALSTLQSAAKAIASSDRWQLFQTQSADESVVTASAAAGARAGLYNVRVDQLARNHSLVSSGFASSTSTIGTGSLVIELGRYDDSTTNFIANTARSAKTVIVSNGSLSAVRDAINTADAGLTAAIVNTGGGAKLVLSARDTGADNAIRISVTDADGDNTDVSGLSQLAFDRFSALGTGRNLEETQAARNARINVNGIDIENASNRVDSAIEGLSFNLKRESFTPVMIDVAADNATPRKNVDAFLAAYNDLNKTLTDLTKYAEGQTTGSLQGERTVMMVQNQLRAILRGEMSASATTFANLSEAGIEQQRDGSVKLNDKRWSGAIVDMDKLSRLFANIGVASDSKSVGIARRIDKLIATALGFEGSITSRTEGLQASITTNQKSQERLSDQLSITEKRLRTQYQSLDTRLSSLQSSSNYLNQQLSALASRNNG